MTFDMQDWIDTDMSQRNPWHLKKIHKNIEDLRQILRPEDSLLDAGCCQGHLYSQLGHRNYTGIDLLLENIVEARMKNPGVDFSMGNILDLTGQWDVVFCCRVLIHLPDYAGAVERLIEASRRACVVVIPIGNDETTVEHRKGRKTYFRSFSRKTVESVAGCESIIEHSPYSTIIYRP